MWTKPLFTTRFGLIENMEKFRYPDLFGCRGWSYRRAAAGCSWGSSAAWVSPPCTRPGTDSSLLSHRSAGTGSAPWLWSSAGAWKVSETTMSQLLMGWTPQKKHLWIIKQSNTQQRPHSLTVEIREERVKPEGKALIYNLIHIPVCRSTCDHEYCV